MSYEVELKFPVADLPAFSRQLASQVSITPAQEETDVYFAHPSRDFARTDEALRLRRKGDANYITYKGPKIDATTKTRREIELPLAAGAESLASWTALLEAVGFRPVGEVRKSRRKAAVPWQGRQVEASLGRSRRGRQIRRVRVGCRGQRDDAAAASNPWPSPWTDPWRAAKLSGTPLGGEVTIIAMPLLWAVLCRPGQSAILENCKVVRSPGLSRSS